MKEKLKKYWRVYSRNNIASGRVSWLHPHKIAKQGILSALFRVKTYAHGRLLDVGCGDKPYENIFRNVNEYVGIDLPIEQSANKSEKNADIFCSALKLPFEDATFDTVLSTQVLEHVPDPRLMFSEMSRVLKKDGILILTAPFIWSLHEEPHDYFRYTKYGLRYLAKNSGFEIIYIKPTCGSMRVVGQKIAGSIYYFRGVSRMLAVQIIKRLLCVIISSIFTFFDKINKNRGDTLDNILVCRKL